MGDIRVKVQDVAKAHGIKNAHRLQIALDVAPMVARRLWNGDLKQMDFRTLATLCRVFDCQPGDLLTYEKKSSKKRRYSIASSE